MMTRGEAIDALDNLLGMIEDNHDTDYDEAFKMAINALKNPERKMGKWEVHNILDYAQRSTGRKVGKCPFCGFLTDEFRTLIECNAKLTNFCPNCGAEMKGEDDD